GAAAGSHDRVALERRPATSPDPADTARRARADADIARARDRLGTTGVAAGLVPAGDRRRRRGAGGAGGRALPARQARRRPVLRDRTVRVAAGGEGTGFGIRQRRRRGGGVAEGGVGNRRAEAGQGRGSRPVPATAD